MFKNEEVRHRRCRVGRCGQGHGPIGIMRCHTDTVDLGEKRRAARRSRYAEPDDPADQQYVMIYTGKDGQHAIKLDRLRKGDTVALADGAGFAKL